MSWVLSDRRGRLVWSPTQPVGTAYNYTPKQTWKEMGKYFPDLTLQEEQNLQSALKSQFPGAKPQERFEMAKQYVAKRKTKEQAPEQAEPKSFIQKVGGALQQRWENIVNNVKDFEQQRKTAVDEKGFRWAVEKGIQLPREAVQVAWDIAGAAWDVLGLGMMEIIKRVPKFIKEPVKDLAIKVAETPLWRQGIEKLVEWMDQYKERASQNPEAAKTLESVYNVAELSADLLGWGFAFKWAKATAKATLDWAWAVAKAGGNTVDVLTTGVLGLTTGTSPDTIRTALRSAGTPDFLKGLRWKIDETDVLETVKKGIGNLRDNRSKLYGAWYQKLLDSDAQVDVNGIAQGFYSKLTEKGWFNVIATTQGDDIILDFTKSTISRESPQRKVIEDIFADLKQWMKDWDYSPASMDILKKRIDDYYKVSDEFGQSNILVKDLSKSIAKKIQDVVPEYAEMNAKYSELTTLLRDIEWAVGIGGNKQTSTAIIKLKGALRRNQEFRQVMLNELNTYADGDFLAQLAWIQLNEVMPRGLMWAIAGWATLINPSFLVGLAAASPRVIWELANIIGVSVNTIKKGIVNANKFVNTWLGKTDDLLRKTNLDVVPIDISTAVSGDSSE